MKKRICALMLVLIMVLLPGITVSAEEITANGRGYENIPFSNGYKGFCIDRDKDGVYGGETFSVADSTSAATNNKNGQDISQNLKILFTYCFEDIFEMTGDGGYEISSPNTILGVMYHYSEEQYVWGAQKSLTDKIATYNGPEIPDNGYQKTLANGDIITFYFKVMVPDNQNTQYFFAYKIDVEKAGTSVAVTGVSIQKTLDVNLGESQTPTYTVNPAEATNKAVTFSSDNTAVATVNETTGEVSGVKKGTAVITVTTADGNFTDTCTVTVSCAHAATTPVAAQDSDCKTPGWDAYKTCNTCGQILSAQGAELQEIPYRPLTENHTGGTATCLQKATCSVCQKEYGSLANHKWSQVWDYKDVSGHAHTCTENGCNEHDSIVPHTPNIPVATEHQAKVCTDCGYVIQPQLQHVHSTTQVPAEPANCTEAGNTEYYTCTCGKWFKDANATQEITNKDSVNIPKEGHQYNEKIKDAAHLRLEAANCQEYDTYWFDCSKCNANAKNDGSAADKWYTTQDAGGHIMGQNWTQENDKHFHKCTVNGCTHIDTKTPCSGGSATCQSKATCSTCNNSYGNVADHKWSEELTYREEDGHAKTCTFPGCTQQSTVEAHKDTNDDGICDICNRDSNIIVEIPFVKVVEQTGEETPGKATFTFEIIEYGNSNAEGEVDIVANTLTTDGKGKFNGVIKLKLTEEELNDKDYLAEGLYIREKKETVEGWTYSQVVWYALLNEQTGVWKFFVVENGVTSHDVKAEMSFTNSYNTKTPPDTPKQEAPQKESPKTGDKAVIGVWVLVMMTSGWVVFASKKRKLSEN